MKHKFDCNGCKFHDFMLLYGFEATHENCWVHCTDDNTYDDINRTFEMILDHTFINNAKGMVLYNKIFLPKGVELS